jgi:hypothetical protein
MTTLPRFLTLLAALTFTATTTTRAAAPVVSNLTAAQRFGTKLVDITYDVTADTPTPKSLNAMKLVSGVGRSRPGIGRRRPRHCNESGKRPCYHVARWPVSGWREQTCLDIQTGE